MFPSIHIGLAQQNDVQPVGCSFMKALLSTFDESRRDNASRSKNSSTTGTWNNTISAFGWQVCPSL